MRGWRERTFLWFTTSGRLAEKNPIPPLTQDDLRPRNISSHAVFLPLYGSHIIGYQPYQHLFRICFNISIINNWHVSLHTLSELRVTHQAKYHDKWHQLQLSTDVIRLSG
jgi:hypothetical protein